MGKKKRPTEFDAFGAIDSHAHLERGDYAQQVDGVLDRAWNHGISAIVAVAAGKAPAVFAETAALASAHSRIRMIAGIHPHYASAHSTLWAPLTAGLKSEEVVAVGELGLDFHYMNSPRQVQLDVMRRQLDLALELSLPAVLHVREAFEEALEVLDEYGGAVSGVVHCFSGDEAAAAEYLSRGLYLSVPGIVTFPKATALQEALAGIPRDRLLVETDCPYLAPAPFRGRTNEPAYLAFTVAAVAEALGMGPAALAALTAENTRRVFNM